MIRVGFFETIAMDWAGGPDGESLHSLLPGANSRRAAGVAMEMLVGHPARSVCGMR